MSPVLEQEKEDKASSVMKEEEITMNDYANITFGSLARDYGYPAGLMAGSICALNYLNAHCVGNARPARVLIASITALGVSILCSAYGALCGGAISQLSMEYASNPDMFFWGFLGATSVVGLLGGLWLGHKVAVCCCSNSAPSRESEPTMLTCAKLTYWSTCQILTTLILKLALLSPSKQDIAHNALKVKDFDLISENQGMMI